MNNDINNFVPSLLNPRTVNKENFPLTQNSVASRCSLSLKRNNVLAKRNINQTVPARRPFASNVKNQDSEKNNRANSISAFASKQTTDINDGDTNTINFFEDINEHKNVNNERPLTGTFPQRYQKKLNNVDIANASTVNLSSDNLPTRITNWNHIANASTVNLSLDNLPTTITNGNQREVLKALSEKSKESSLDFSFIEDFPFNKNNIEIENVVCNNSLKSGSSATELYKCTDTIVHDLIESQVSISFGVQNCDYIDLTTKNTNIKRVLITRRDNELNLDCDIVAETLSSESEYDENMNLTPPQKRSGVAVNLEIKKKKLASDNSSENAKVLILKTDAIEKLSHVIVQPQNCKLVKRHLDRNKFENIVRKDGKSGNLKQKLISSFFAKQRIQSGNSDVTENVIVEDEATEMSRNTTVSEMKCARPYRPDVKGEPAPGGQARVASAPRAARARPAPAPSARSSSPLQHSASSHRTHRTLRAVPHYKIVAGTHFAVDAFSYGDIPNVKHYFLTHFHSDHYSGLKKNFNKLLYCSKITGDLCISRLGVNPKYIHVLNLEETTRIEGVEVTAVDANHCPGAVMLFFCLPNGKTVLHTGDFRASPAMESYPVFWNSDVHTIYLDTTYCNPRYDFPTQEQSLEMALALLRSKKIALEKVGKKFSSVLIVCGTYTIGKEKFFLGMARRVGCSVWACPEKDKVLQAVEGRSFSASAPQACQLHAVPMRDLAHEKLKSYLESLKGAFSEVVAFKPSGWENGKNTTVEKDNVTIHGIPYSEHSSFSELIRFVKFLKPKQVIPTVDISGGIKAVQKYFPCPLVKQEDTQNQSKVTDYFSIESRQQVPAVT